MNDRNEVSPEPPEDDPDSLEEFKKLELQLKQSAEYKARQFFEKTIQQLLSSSDKKPPKEKIVKAVDQTIASVESVFM